MISRRIQVRGIARRFVAAALALWVAGVGCLLGCEARALHEASAATLEVAAAGQSDQTETCAAFGGRDCCHKAQGEQPSGDSSADRDAFAFDLPLPTSEGLMCCPLSPQPSDPARKLSFNQAPLASDASDASPTFHAGNFLRQIQKAAPLVPDRGSTYLRCCVFLI
ncbi:MAG: hypothetical protein ACRD9R_06590 [Pyrinomonadaceae bacterium]